ncbi:MAG: DUF3857 domain-containing protein [Planctomycetes bacterium]|nr:DUF3857 domain-containing protein [Planctomycetota bacterium]
MAPVLVLALLALLSPTAQDVADLTERAGDVLAAGRPEAARALLLDGLLERLAAPGALDDPLARADAEVAALLLGDLTGELSAWPETLARLDPVRPWPDATPPRVAFLLEQLRARALRATGRPDAARGAVDDLGALTSFWLAGPFDNAHGAGFAATLPPEQRFARDEPMPGKAGPVTWRPNPLGNHPLGRIELDEMLRPATQAVAYLATALRPLEPGTVVLRIGSTGPFRVFLDGHVVGERDVERPLASDQDRVVLPLDAGWNQLLVKLAVEDGPWTCELRLTDVDGRPVPRLGIDRAFTSWPEPPPEVILFYDEHDTDDWSPFEDPDFDWSLLVDMARTAGLEVPDEVAALQGPELLGALAALPGADALMRGMGFDPSAMGGPPPGDEGDGGGDDARSDAHDGLDARGATATATEAEAEAEAAAETETEAGTDRDTASAQRWGGPWPSRPAVRLAPEAFDILSVRDDDPRAARLLVWLHLLVHPDDVAGHAAREAAEHALALAPDDARAAWLLARAARDPWATPNETDANLRVSALERVLALRPEHVEALLDLADFTLRESPLPERADELTARALAAAPRSFRALVTRAAFVEQRGRPGEAAQLRRRAEDADDGRTRIASALLRAGRLFDAGESEASLAVLREGAARDVARDRLVDVLFDRLLDAGDVDGALRAVETALAASPGDTRTMLRAAERLAPLDDAHARMAVDLVLRALDVCPDHKQARELLARLRLRLGDEQAAVDDLRALDVLDPGRPVVRAGLAILAGETVEPFEQPWRWDARDLLAQPLPDPSRNDPLEVLRRTVVWRLHDDGTEHRYEHLALRVLNAGGAKALDTYALRADAEHSELFVYGVRVLRADGGVEPAPPPRTPKDETRRYDLPPLRPGDVVDVEYRVDQHRPDLFGRSFGTRHDFCPGRLAERAPVRESELVVVAPPGLALHVSERQDALIESTRDVDADGDTVLTFAVHDLQPPLLETDMPPREELVPLVDVTSFDDWTAFGAWWWHLVEKEFVTTPAMREKVAELTAGLSDERARIEAVVRFVAQDVRYNAWPFGTHGYEPYSAATIFERRFGDCKDKSILLRQLLAEIGVDCEPVLLKADPRPADDPLDVALVNRFNHCIAWLPPSASRAGMYVDATAERNPLDALRADDQGAQCLHVRADGVRVERIPYDPPDRNRLVRTWDVALSADGSADVTLRDASTGQFGVRLRERFAGEPGDLARAVANRLAPLVGPIDVRSVRRSELDDISVPAWLEADFAARDLLTPRGGGESALRLVLDPSGLEDTALESEETRVHDLVLERPFGLSSDVRYRLPPGASATRVPEPVTISVPGLLEYSLAVDVDQGSLLVRRRLDLLERRVPLARYGEFRRALVSIAEAERAPLLVASGVERS